MSNPNADSEKITLKQQMFLLFLFLFCLVISAIVLLYCSPAKTTGSLSGANSSYSEYVRSANA